MTATPETTLFRKRGHSGALAGAKALLDQHLLSNARLGSGAAIAGTLGKYSPLAPSPYNQTAWSALEPASANPSDAVLLVWDEDAAGAISPAWQFLINPQQLQWSNSANYQSVETLAASSKHWSFSSTEGRTLKIPNLIMSVWCYGRSLRPLIEGVNALLRARVKENQYAPPLLRFRWGARDFGPCILTNVEWTESQWLSGHSAAIQLSLTLKEVERPLSDGEREQQLKSRRELLTQQNLANGAPPLPLTKRQQKEAIAKAFEFLKSTKKQYSADVQKAIAQMEKDKSATGASVDPATGVVVLGRLGRVGQYNGKVLTTKNLVGLPKAEDEA